MSPSEASARTRPQPESQPPRGWAAIISRLTALAANPKAQALALMLLVAQVLWGLRRSQDLPSTDEAWALTDGLRLAHGGAVSVSWWNSPLYTLLYAASGALLRTAEATFYGQRLALTLLSVLAIFWLLRRLLPAPLAWLGAAWFAVSPQLIDLPLDRSDFLAAAICTWAALAILDHRSARRFGAALALAVAAFLFRPEYLLVVGAVSFYGLAQLLYQRLPQPKRTRQLVVGGIGLALATGGAALAVAVLFRSGSIGGYFMWVFANNRLPIVRDAPIWVVFERDYGPSHTILAILGHPAALARDVLANTRRMVEFAKAATTGTAWAALSLRVERWMAALALLALAAAVRARRDLPAVWNTFWAGNTNGWLGVACLLPLLATNFILAPLPIYLLLFMPIIFGGLLLLGYAALRGLLVTKPIFFPLLIAAMLVIAPVARSFTGEQPVRHLVDFFRQLPATGPALIMLGDASTTICAYLEATGQACAADEWTDNSGYPKLDDLMRRRPYTYLVYDNNMAYLLAQPVGLSEVLAKRDPRWQLVQVYGEYQVYQYVAGQP